MVCCVQLSTKVPFIEQFGCRLKKVDEPFTAKTKGLKSMPNIKSNPNFSSFALFDLYQHFGQFFIKLHILICYLDTIFCGIYFFLNDILDCLNNDYDNNSNDIFFFYLYFY